MKVAEFFAHLSVDGLSWFEAPKEDDTNEGVAKDEDEHAHDDEEALVDGDSDGLHEHAEGGVLPGDGQESVETENEAKKEGRKKKKCLMWYKKIWGRKKGEGRTEGEE